MPDIMAQRRRAAARGRHHQPHPPARLPRRARCRRPALILKVHPSNYRIEGFTAEAARPRTARARPGSRRAAAQRPRLRHARRPAGLRPARRADRARRRSPRADLVTFSGDKLLGGPQAGFIVGRADLDRRDQPQPAEARAPARQDPHRRAGGDAAPLPRPRPPRRAAADAAAAVAPRRRRSPPRPPASRPPVAARLGVPVSSLSPAPARSAPGALPVDTIPSAGLRHRPRADPEALAARLRARAPRPILGRIRDGALVLDLRCLTDEAGFLAAPRHDRRHRRAYRPRQDRAGEGADRHRCRPAEGGEGPRHHHRPRLRLRRPRRRGRSPASSTCPATSG